MRGPQCGYCQTDMTPDNSRIMPEMFTCDACLRRHPDERVKAAVRAWDEAHPNDLNEQNTLGTDETDAAPQWAIVELMGHVRLVGILTEESKFGVTMGRIDALDRNGSFVTQWFSGGSVYRVTPTDEATARLMVMPARPSPALYAPSREPEFDDDESGL